MKRAWWALLVVVAMVVSACGSSTASPGGSSSSNGGGTGSACNYKFAVITHGDNGSFWSVVYKGANDAAAKLGCTVTVYGSQQQGQAEPDDNAQNTQIQNAINAKVDGIAVSDHSPALMNPTLASAVKAGIPVVLLNAGCDDTDIAASGAMTCVGQPETLAGKQAGARFMSENATNILCVIHQSGQNLLDRCNGIAQALGTGDTCSTGTAPSSGKGCTELTLSVANAAANPQDSAKQVIAYLQAHPQINAIMTLNNAIAQGVQAALPSGSSIKLATFDLNTWDIQGVQNGQVDFIVDQQQYLQGYLAVDYLYLYKAHHGASVGGGTTVATGPLLVDKTNVSNVSAAAAAGES